MNNNKWSILLLALVMVLSMAGCAKTNQDNEINETVAGGYLDQYVVDGELKIPEDAPQEVKDAVSYTPPIQQPAEKTPAEEEPTEEEPAEEAPAEESDEPAAPSFKHISELLPLLNEEEYIIFRGVKEHDIEWGDFSQLLPSEITVLEPLYGAVQTGDVIELMEYSSVSTNMGPGAKFSLRMNGNIDLIFSRKEYIFILKINEKKDAAIACEHVYEKYATTPLNKRQDYAEKVANNTATDLEKFRHSVLETYLPQ